MLRITAFLREIPARYRILPPLFGVIAGILSGGYFDKVWLAIVLSGLAAGLVSLFYPQPGVPEIPERGLPPGAHNRRARPLVNKKRLRIKEPDGTYHTL
jgi:hypothetical protein